MDKKDIMQSKTMKTTTIVVGVLLVALVSFAFGMAVGFHKARFSYAFGENYERNFMMAGRTDNRGDEMFLVRGREAVPSTPSFSRDFDGRGFRNGHGLIGEIISISDNSLVVKDPSGEENIVTLSDKTLVRAAGDTMSIADLKGGDKIAVIGTPGDDGAVNADFIRVLGESEVK